MDDVLARVDSGVAVITLNRPDSANALTRPMLDGLRDFLAGFAHDDAVGAVVLTGAGKHFCAGGDVHRMAAGLGMFVEAGGDAEQVAAQQQCQRDTVGALIDFPKPTIAVLPGSASGAGLSLALACDVRYAAHQAKIAVGFLRVGLAGDFGFSWLLPAVVGPSRAREIAFFSSVLTAEEALNFGVLNALQPRDLVLDFALEKARAVAALPHEGVGQLKLAFNRVSRGASLEDAMDEEARHYVRLRQLPAHQQALDSLKRPG